MEASGSWGSSILGSHSRVMEGKTKNWMFDQAKQVLNASCVLKRERSKTLGVLTYGHES